MQRQRHNHKTSEHIVLPHSSIPQFVILCSRAVTCSMILPEHPTYGQNLHRQVREVVATRIGATSACLAAAARDCTCVSQVALHRTVKCMQHELSWCVLHVKTSCDARDTSYLQYTKSPDDDVETNSSLAARSVAGSKSHSCLAESTHCTPDLADSEMAELADAQTPEQHTESGARVYKRTITRVVNASRTIYT